VQRPADLVERNFTAIRPNQVWFADITYVPTWEGWLFLAVVMDACTKRIVGWSMRDDIKADIVVDALGMGTTMRRPEPGLVHHSDRGAQYRSLVFGKVASGLGPPGLDGRDGNAARQRGHRVGDGDDQEGVRVPSQVQNERRGEVRDLPLHGGLLQPAQKALVTRQLVSGGVRAETAAATATGCRVGVRSVGETVYNSNIKRESNVDMKGLGEIHENDR